MGALRGHVVSGDCICGSALLEQRLARWVIVRKRAGYWFGNRCARSETIGWLVNRRGLGLVDGNCPTQAKRWLEWATRRQSCALRLANQQVDVLGHHNVAVDAEPVTEPDAFERRLEYLLGRVRAERIAAMVAAEGGKVSLAGLVKALESPRHGGSVRLRTELLKLKSKSKEAGARSTAPLKPKEGLNGPPAQISVGEGVPLPTPRIQVVHGTVPQKCARNTLPARSGILYRPALGELRCRPLPTSSARAPEVTPN